MSSKVWSSRALKRWMLSTVQPWTRQKSYHLFIIMWQSVYKGKVNDAGEGMTGLPLSFYKLTVSIWRKELVHICDFFNESSRIQPIEMKTFELAFWILLFSGNTLIKCITECPTSFSSRSIIILVCDSYNFLHNLLKMATFFNSAPLTEYLDLTMGSSFLFFFFQELCMKYIFVKWLIFLNTQENYLFKLSGSLYPFLLGLKPKIWPVEVGLWSF